MGCFKLEHIDKAYRSEKSFFTGNSGLEGIPEDDFLYVKGNHLGNVLTVITDKKEPLSSNGTTVDNYQVHIVSVSDYSPFGVVQNGRNFENKEYRYAFNGMEEDPEVKGSKNSYNFGARMLDPRLGRWLSRDPLEAAYASYSPYCFVVNSPLRYVDPDGERVIIPRALNGGRKGVRKIRKRIRYRMRNDAVFAAQFRQDRSDNNLHVFRSTEYNGGNRSQIATWRTPQVQQITQGVVNSNRRYSRIVSRLQRRANRQQTPGNPAQAPNTTYDWRPADQITTAQGNFQGLPNTQSSDVSNYNLPNNERISSFQIQGNNFNAPDRVVVSDASGNVLFDTQNMGGANANGQVQNNYNSGVVNIPAGGRPISLTVSVNPGLPANNGTRFNYNITLQGGKIHSTISKEARRHARRTRRSGGNVNFVRP